MTGPMTGAFGADDVVVAGAMIRKLRFQMIADMLSVRVINLPSR